MFWLEPLTSVARFEVTPPWGGDAGKRTQWHSFEARVCQGEQPFRGPLGRVRDVEEAQNGDAPSPRRSFLDMKYREMTCLGAQVWSHHDLRGRKSSSAFWWSYR